MQYRYISLALAGVAAASPAATKTTSAKATSTASCTVTNYTDVPAAVKSCSAITLDGITVPGGSTLDLQDLKDGATVTFAGTTSFEYAEEDYNMIRVGGADITITGAAGHVLDGNGAAWWDGKGSNGGKTKPDHFFTVHRVTGKSTISNLNVKNWPVHGFDVTSCSGLTITNVNMDNTAGNAANAASSGLPAAHNSDGFDISSCDSVTISNTKVDNQDDCVAVSSGSNILVTGMTCIGGHGLSIGSVGGKSNNTVDGVTFSDSTISNSQNGARIKTNSGKTGIVNDVTWSNITLSNITVYGIDIQQDYLNGGPTGKPTGGVPITNIGLKNIQGTAASSARDYYILCASGACSNFTIEDVSITGGTNNSCNYSDLCG